MVSCALTKLVDAIYNDNPCVTMSFVVDLYYNKEAKYPRLPWEVRKEIGVDGSLAGSHCESADGDGEESGSSIASC